MGTSRRRLRSLAVLMGTAVCATLPMTSAAHAAAYPAVTLTVNGQPAATSQTVSGVIDVVADVTPVPGVPVQSVQFYVFGRLNSAPITVNPGDCDAGCHFEWKYDTTTLTPFVPGGPDVPLVPDGSEVVGVRVNTAGDTGGAESDLLVDNHRPWLGATFSGPWRGTAPKTMTFTLTPGVSKTAPTGTTLADIALVSPQLPGGVLAHFAPNGDGTWTAHLDAGGLAPGRYVFDAVGTDSTGTVGAPVGGATYVDTGLNLHEPASAVVDPNGSGLTLDYSYPAWNGCGTGTPTPVPHAVNLQLDGQPFASLGFDPRQIQPANGHCVLPLSSMAGNLPMLPYGRHTLSWTVDDGIEAAPATASEQITVALPLIASWPLGSRTLTAGSTVTATADVAAPDGFSTLRSWTVTDANGATLASGTGASTPSVALATPVNQETGDTVRLRLVSDSGLVTTEEFSYQTGWATSAYSHVSAGSVKRGSYVSLYASDWVRVHGTWAFDVAVPATVRYQWEVPGSNVWHNGPLVSVTGAAPRPAAAQMRVGGNVCFRSVYTQSSPLVTSFGSTLIPATSTPVCVTAR